MNKKILLALAFICFAFYSLNANAQGYILKTPVYHDEGGCNLDPQYNVVNTPEKLTNLFQKAYNGLVSTDEVKPVDFTKQITIFAVGKKVQDYCAFIYKNSTFDAASGILIVTLKKDCSTISRDSLTDQRKTEGGSRNPFYIWATNPAKISNATVDVKRVEIFIGSELVGEWNLGE